MLKNGAKNGFSSTGRGKRHTYGNLAVAIVYKYHNLTIQGLGAGFGSRLGAIFGILELMDTLQCARNRPRRPLVVRSGQKSSYLGAAEFRYSKCAKN